MEKIRKHSWSLAFISTLSAIGLHSYLTFKYYALRFGAMGEASFCNFSDLWNCDAVSASQYAQLFGVPIALWGLTTNLVFVFVLLFSRLGWFENDERSRRYNFWFALIVILASVAMGIISLTMVHSLCLFCVITYGLSVTTFLGVYFWARPVCAHFAEDVTALFKVHHFMLGCLIAVPALAFLLNSMFVDKYKMGQLGLFAEERIAQWQQSAAQSFTAGEGLVAGSDQPKMDIVEFADFRCPHCKVAYLSLEAFVKAHPDSRITYKFFPLDGTCNPSMGQGKGDGISCEAAFVTHCAEKLFKKGWSAHHFLFDNQEKLQGLSKREDVREMVCSALALDCPAITTCSSSPDTLNEVQAMAAEGSKAGLQGTPTIFVNGKMLSGGQLIPILEKAYESLKAD